MNTDDAARVLPGGTLQDGSCGVGRRTVVTAGPTITADAVRNILPAAEVVAPIQFGDTYTYRLRTGDTLVVVDGLFWQTASVRHRELLDLIHAGVEVYGCSSMGALRAAELTEFGMVGYGQVFDAYRTGHLVGDCEVGTVHGLPEDGYTVGVDALVNVRATLDLAVATGRLTREDTDALVAEARARGFTDRSWGAIARAVGLEDTARRELLAWVRTRPTDVKRDDAVELLTMLADGQPASRIAAAAHNAATVRPTPGPSGFTSSWRWNRAPLVAVETAAGPATVSAGDLMEMAALSDPQFPQWRHERMLRVLAARRGDPPTPAQPSQSPAAAEPGTPRPSGVDDETWADWCERETTLRAHSSDSVTDESAEALERAAVRHLVAAGVLTDEDSALPEPLETSWLSAAEHAEPARTRAALVATRCAAAVTNSVLSRTLLVDLALTGRLPELAEEVVAVRETFARLAPRYTGNLSAQGRRVVYGWWEDRWGTQLEIGLRQRGLIDLPELGIMVALVDVGSRQRND